MPGPRRAGEREPSDEELLRSHIAGDPDAFGQLFLRHKDRLWAIAIRTLADPEDAADAVQDAMISAFRRAGSFRGDAAVTTWLHRIVVNACLDRLRRRAARPEVSSGDQRLLDAIAVTGPHGAAGDPAAGVEISMEVTAALRQLPRHQRAALVLVDMLDYPVADAAEVLGIAEGTVKSRCARGRARLLSRLGHLRQGATADTGSTGRASAEPGGTGPADTGSGNYRSGPSGRNRIASGAVLPAREGGDEAQ